MLSLSIADSHVLPVSERIEKGKKIRREIEALLPLIDSQFQRFLLKSEDKGFLQVIRRKRELYAATLQQANTCLEIVCQASHQYNLRNHMAESDCEAIMNPEAAFIASHTMHQREIEKAEQESQKSLLELEGIRANCLRCVTQNIIDEESWNKQNILTCLRYRKLCIN